ncbi:dienelactone hydrolase family protein [Mucilaginibacter paludis]|uniref:Dienelactone hydrolase n=1 Tax=Mucilaginibacter paludis DSM 18603 TaxID=714943 RepID=H1XZT7_9SPHI|nr:dienelactone hydrolase family protein [Mucilaginibacter paludis]EHQ27779.1 dienelactone hydrolase [Mucilaginibacter paludis DSM 18603]
MKKLLLLIAVILTGSMAYSQNKGPVACCYPTATQRFAMLANNPKFVKAHPNPLPFRFQSAIAKAITYKTPDGKTAVAYELKAKKTTNNYLLVVHEYFGLNDYIKQVSEKLYNDLGNVNVIALDLYDGKVTADRNEAAKLMQSVKEDRAQAIVKGAIAYAGSKARIATIGWCFGGGWSLQTTLLAGKQAVGCVMYYGMPEQDVDKLKTLNTDVLGLFGNKDQWINPKVVATFEENMKKAGKKLTVYSYDADHAFANPSGPNYNSTAGKDAYAHTLAFLKPRLK